MGSTVTPWARWFCLLFLVSTLSTACSGGVDGLPQTDSSATQYLVISIDVEALPARQSEDHVERLIYGNFPPVGRAGIIDMMDIADRYNVKLTFFLDVLEEVIYPKQIEAVARLIVDRGHDLQLHTHPSIMPDQFFAKLGIQRKDTNLFNEAEASALFDETNRIVASWSISPFIAYRAGSYRYSQGFVQAMHKAGIMFSYNYNINGHSQRRLELENVPMFRWENNVVEVPVSYINQPGSNPIQFNDSTYINTNDIESAYDLIFKFQNQWASPNVLVMMMHSWSFLELNPESGFREYKDASKAVLFDRFLASLPEQVKVITATELSQLVARGLISVPYQMNTAEVFRQ